jgi:hypothetical protein
MALNNKIIGLIIALIAIVGVGAFALNGGLESNDNTPKFTQITIDGVNLTVPYKNITNTNFDKYYNDEKNNLNITAIDTESLTNVLEAYQLKSQTMVGKNIHGDFNEHIELYLVNGTYSGFVNPTGIFLHVSSGNQNTTLNILKSLIDNNPNLVFQKL